MHPGAATSDDVFCTLYHRDAEFAALAEAELSALGGGTPLERGVWGSSTPIRWARCGYGRDGGGLQLAAAATIDELEAKLTALAIVAPRFRVRLVRLPKNLRNTMDPKIRVADCIDGDPFEDDLDLELLLVASRAGLRVLIDAPVSPGEADWQRASHKPHNYVVALPFRIAQAMLNLSLRPGDTVLDPFCGSGTIPLLAAWAGHEAYGSDISGACVARARQNLAHFGRTATLLCADARAAQQRADVVVTNLPYGLYSHFAGDALGATLANLATLAPRATFVTSEHIERELEDNGYEIERIIPVEPRRFQRFVYVTRVAGR